MPPLSMYDQRQNCSLRRASSSTTSSEVSNDTMVRVVSTTTTTTNKPLTELTTSSRSTPMPSSSMIARKTNKKTKKKCVTFAPHARAKRHLHVNDFTPEELEACWFDAEDFECIKDECHAIALVLCSSSSSSSNFLLQDNDRLGFCKRGIEHLTQIGSKRRLKNKVTGWDAVLDAQQDMIVSDPTYIAKAYYPISYECLIAAHARGLQDEKDSPLACLL